MKRLLTAAMLLFTLPAAAQTIASICEAYIQEDNPEWATSGYDSQRDADDFCAVAMSDEPHKAARQLSKALAANRAWNNRNRYYFDPKSGPFPPDATHIQF